MCDPGFWNCSSILCHGLGKPGICKLGHLAILIKYPIYTKRKRLWSFPKVWQENMDYWQPAWPAGMDYKCMSHMWKSINSSLHTSLLRHYAKIYSFSAFNPEENAFVFAFNSTFMSTIFGSPLKSTLHNLTVFHRNTVLTNFRQIIANILQPILPFSEKYLCKFVFIDLLQIKKW